MKIQVVVDAKKVLVGIAVMNVQLEGSISQHVKVTTPQYFQELIIYIFEAPFGIRKHKLSGVYTILNFYVSLT